MLNSVSLLPSNNCQNTKYAINKNVKFSGTETQKPEKQANPPKSKFDIAAIGVGIAGTVFGLFEMAKAKNFKGLAHGFKSIAETDPLTGLYRKEMADVLIPKAMEEAKKTGNPLHIFFADFDHFKSVNETLGHQKGDQFLKRMANIIKDTIGEDGFVVKNGGEEFLIALPNCNEKKAVEKSIEISKRITEDKEIQSHIDEFLKIARNKQKEALEEKYTLLKEGTDPNSEKIKALSKNADNYDTWANHVENHKFTLSLGGLKYDPEIHESHSALIKASDSMLEKSKKNRNTLTIKTETGYNSYDFGTHTWRYKFSA